MRFSVAQSAAAFLALAGDSLAKDWESPAYTWLYQYPLPIPEVKKEKWPDRSVINPLTNKKIKYYEVEIKEFQTQVYPNKGKTTHVGYDGVAPGMTFLEEKDVETVIRFINRAKLPNSVHLHGSYSRAPYDGWAEDTTEPGEYKDYYYPNSQSGRMMWYHDHAIEHTAENAYFGQAGVYLLHDPAEDKLGLPSGYGKYDIPLVLSAKQYNNDATLFSPAGQEDSIFGDVMHVNGQPWPYFKVEPRKYRFRFLNAAISRTFQVYFEGSKTPGKKAKFDVIASDGGLLSAPQNVEDMYISMAERYEVVFDFSQFKGQNVTLRNVNKFADDKEYLHTDKLMRFVVSNPSTPVVDDSKVPSSLRTIPYPAKKTGVDRKFLFHRTGSQWRINGITFADVANRVLANVERGSVEVWELENSSGGWSHPIHVHLVDFEVVSRTGGKRGNKVFPYESAGLKDVVWLAPNEKVTVRAHFAPHAGVYMFHCHNLIHEDHEMMAAFNVTDLKGWGYNETDFTDPMDPNYRAAKEGAGVGDYDNVQKKIGDLMKLEPYLDLTHFDDWYKDFMATRTAATSQPTATGSSGTGNTGSGSSGTTTTAAVGSQPTTTTQGAAQGAAQGTTTAAAASVPTTAVSKADDKSGKNKSKDKGKGKRAHARALSGDNEAVEA